MPEMPDKAECAFTPGVTRDKPNCGRIRKVLKSCKFDQINICQHLLATSKTSMINANIRSNSVHCSIQGIPWGDLLRFVPSPKWVGKFKLLCTTDYCGFSKMINSHYLQY